MLAVALLLVFGIGKLLGGTGQDPTARRRGEHHLGPAGAASSSAPTVGPVAPSVSPGTTKGPKAVLLPPSGECRTTR